MQELLDVWNDTKGWFVFMFIVLFMVFIFAVDEFYIEHRDRIKQLEQQVLELQRFQCPC